MSDAPQQQPFEPTTLVATKATTLVATKALVERVQPSSGPDPEPRWSAARLPIVERDSYEISGEIAHGGVGRILQGRSVHLDRPVAIKELLDPGDAAAERFVCEALLTARLQHPSIVPVYEAGRWPSGELFYAMKLVSGRSLADVLEHGDPQHPGPPSFAARLLLLPHVVAVAAAIAYAHSERIIHRDLKPANILVGSFGETVVIDWGLAKDLSGEAPVTMGETPKPPAQPVTMGETPKPPAQPVTMGETPKPPAQPVAMGETPKPPAQPVTMGETPKPPGMIGEAPKPPAPAPPSTPPPSSGDAPYRAPEGITMAGAVMGTPAYMPPEQARGLAVDERADVYALGAILYHVLAGAPPYEGRDVRAILRAVAAGPPGPLERRARGVSLELATIVHKAMARDPASRYPSARELAEDLMRFAAGQVVGAHRYTRGELLLRAVRRFRAPLTVAAAALVALSAAIGVGFRRTVKERDRAEEQRLAADAARREAIRHADDLTLVQARTYAAREPDRALGWLSTLSPSFDRWSAARTIAADAGAHGLATVLRGHDEVINGLALSPDGRFLATAGDDHTARLWDLVGHDERDHRAPGNRVLSGHGDEVWGVEFSSDGRLLATSSKDKTIRVWDLETRASRLLLGHAGPVTAVVFLPDGKRLVSVGTDAEVRRWDIATGQSRLLGLHRDALRALTCSRDGRFVATGSTDGEVRLWSLERDTSESLGKLPWGVAGAVFSPDGSQLAIRGYSGGTALWNLDGRPPIAPPLADVRAAPGAPAPSRRPASLKGPEKGLDAFAIGLVFSRDGRHLAFAGEETSLVIVDTATGARRTLDGREGKVGSLAFSPDGHRLAAGIGSGPVQLWNVDQGTARTLRGFDDLVTGLAFTPDGRSLVASSFDHTVRVFPVETGDDRALDAHGGPLTFTAFSPDGETLATGDADGAVRLWDVGRPAPVLTTGHMEGVCRGAWSPDGTLLATHGLDGAVRLWDRWGQPRRTMSAGSSKTCGGALLFSADARHLAWSAPGGGVGLYDVDADEARVLDGHRDSVLALAFSPDGATLVTGYNDGTARFWSMGEPSGPSAEARVLRGHERGVIALAFSPDGAVLATGGRDHTLRLWNARSDAVAPRIVDASGGGVEQIAFSPDGATIYTGSAIEAGVRAWDTQTGLPRNGGLLRGHEGGIHRFALSPDGGRLATATEDRAVRLWDLATGESRALQGHGAAVVDVAFSPDGRTVASAGADGIVRLWRDDLPSEPGALKTWIREALRGALPVATGETPKPAATPVPTPPGLGAGSEGSARGSKGS